MDSEELEYLTQQIKEYQKDYLDEIKGGIMALWQDAINENVYQIYDPVQYQRSFDLLNNLEMHFDNDGKLIIQTDTDNYYSVVNRKDVSDLVPIYVNSGHNDSSPIQNIYHHYPARHFLEKAKEMIENEYGLECEIILQKV
mgnify:CR=1 FL=1